MVEARKVVGALLILMGLFLVVNPSTLLATVIVDNTPPSVATVVSYALEQDTKEVQLSPDQQQTLFLPKWFTGYARPITVRVEASDSASGLKSISLRVEPFDLVGFASAGYDDNSARDTLAVWSEPVTSPTKISVLVKDSSGNVITDADVVVFDFVAKSVEAVFKTSLSPVEYTLKSPRTIYVVAIYKEGFLPERRLFPVGRAPSKGWDTSGTTQTISVVLSAGDVSNVPLGWTGGSTYKASVPWLFAFGKTYTLTVVATDNAGNEKVCKYVVLPAEYDTNPPRLEVFLMHRWGREGENVNIVPVKNGGVTYYAVPSGFAEGSWLEVALMVYVTDESKVTVRGEGLWSNDFFKCSDAYGTYYRNSFGAVASNIYGAIVATDEFGNTARYQVNVQFAYYLQAELYVNGRRVGSNEVIYVKSPFEVQVKFLSGAPVSAKLLVEKREGASYVRHAEKLLSAPDWKASVELDEGEYRVTVTASDVVGRTYTLSVLRFSLGGKQLPVMQLVGVLFIALGAVMLLGERRSLRAR